MAKTVTKPVKPVNRASPSPKRPAVKRKPLRPLVNHTPGVKPNDRWYAKSN